MSDIIKLIESENLSALKRLLAQEPRRINETDECGVEISFLAARTGNIEIVRYIVEYSMASFNTTDQEERNCLHYAVESGKLDVVQYFVEKVGLSPLEGDKSFVTPFHIAHDKGFKDIENYFESLEGCRLKDMYQNPIRTGLYSDPSIIRVENDYYMVNSTFVFFPCIPISHSTDLIHWKIIGHAITNPKWSYLDHLEGGRGYWAPDISYNEGRFYITATFRMNDTRTIYRKQMVVSSDKPEGPYCEPAFIDEDGIDPSIFTDDDGKRYMLLNRGARIFQISKDGTKQISEAKLLYYGDNKRAPEGPHLIKKDGWYYLFLAEGGTGRGHQINVARSTALFGNYEPCPYNPIMQQKNQKAALQCCGHGKPVMTQNGDWYIVYLCYRYIDEKYGMLGRETAMDPITWTLDGWPMINNGKGPSTLQMKPNLPEASMEDCDFDHFDSGKLDNNWMTARTMEEDGIRLIDSHLRIKGSKKDMNSMDARNFIVRRQKHFSFNAILKMKFPILKEEQNAGLICYYDENTYLKFGLYLSEKNQYLLQVFEKINEEEKISLSVPMEQMETLYLKISTVNLKREFWYSYDNVNWILVGVRNHVFYLCSEGIQKGKRFTGASVGMYAYSGEKETQLYAEFDYFQYVPG